MKGLITTAVLAACGTAALALSARGDDCYDHCYPQRYEFAARQEVNQAMAPQIYNGHVLDQTVGNDYFEAGSDKLTPGGLEHLKYLARRRPHADPVIYLQVAQDVAYDPAKPAEYSKARAELNNKRVQAIQTFLGAYTAGPQDFRVVVHDPGEIGQSAISVGRSVLLMHNSYQGALVGTGGSGGTAGPAR